jgi:hypothetical protein
MVDPKVGFINGGGWFTSPMDSYVNDLNSTGKTSFEFFAMYNNEEDSVPTGETQMQTSDFNFYSTSYEWLIVTNNNCAKLKGSGVVTVDSSREYSFLLTVCEESPTREDHMIRIKIWSALDDFAIYDNQMDADDASLEYASAIEGGTIEVYKDEVDQFK